MGDLCAKGEGVPQDWEEAVRLFRLAADQKDAEAQLQLGLCFAKGEGVPQDWEEAVRFFRLADNQGLAPACIALGGALLEASAGSDPSQTREGAFILARATRQREDTAQSYAALALLGEHAGKREVVRACCIGCGQTKELKVCSKCRVASFCGAECVRPRQAAGALPRRMLPQPARARLGLRQIAPAAHSFSRCATWSANGAPAVQWRRGRAHRRCSGVAGGGAGAAAVAGRVEGPPARGG